MHELNHVTQSALHALAYHYLCQGKNDRALPLLELLLAHNSANSELRLALGYVLLAGGRAEQAAKILAALEVSPHAAAQFLRGKALVQAGQASAAVQAMARYRVLRKRVPSEQAAGLSRPITPT